MYALERAAAIVAVRRAARITEYVRNGDLLHSHTKDDDSPVTVADLAAQAIISMELSKQVPNFLLLGEEDAAVLRTEAGTHLKEKVVAAVRIEEPTATEDDILDAIDAGSYQGGPTKPFWALDPIDGTKGFLRNDQYAIALAYIVEGKPVVGALACPNLPRDYSDDSRGRGVGFIAVSNEGCSQFDINLDAAEDKDEFTKVTVTSNDVSKARVVESVESGHTSHGLSSQVTSDLGIVTDSLRMDSQAKYAALSRGDADVYLRLPRKGKRYDEKIWDHAAGVVVIQEAGGRVTDVFGKDLYFTLGPKLVDNTGVIATNGVCHDAVIESLGKFLEL